MIGPLPTAPGGFNRVLVAIDKFTKWIQVKAVTCPKADRVLDFLDELVHRYGLPHRIIIDLGSNFNNHQFIQDTEGLHKLSSPWEGPFIVAKVTGSGSYRLQTLEGEDINNSWNVD
jgi:hypothetical protein